MSYASSVTSVPLLLCVIAASSLGCSSNPTIVKGSDDGFTGGNGGNGDSSGGNGGDGPSVTAGNGSGGSSGSGASSGGSGVENPCSAIEESTENRILPADIILAIDQS